MDDALYAPVAVREDIYDEQPPLTEVQRVVNTFAAPTKTFADIRRNRSWWLPLLILTLFSYLFTLTAISRVGTDRLAASSIRNNPSQNERMQQASPEQRAQTVHMVGNIMRISFYSWPLIVLLTSAVGALLLWVGFNFILGGTGTYAGMYAVMLFASLPGILRALLSTTMLFLGDPETFNINDPVGTNPGFYLSADTSAFLKAALSSVDLFSLWTLALMAVGGAIVARVRIRSGLILVFSAWLLFVLGRSAIAAATAS